MAVLITDEPTTHFSKVMQGEFAEATAQQQEKAIAELTTEQRILVARALRGDTKAFDDIFDRFNGLMLRTAYRIVRDRDMAEDAVQNALIKAWQYLPSLSETGALRPWLLRIVVNQCLDFKRRLARSRMFLSQSFSEQETLLASQVADDARGCIERGWDLAHAVKQLPAKQQHVILLHYYQGMTLPEISRRSQVSENTLKKRLQAALSNLRRVLWEAEGDETTLLPGPQNQAAGDVSREHHTGYAYAPTKYSSAT